MQGRASIAALLFGLALPTGGVSAQVAMDNVAKSCSGAIYQTSERRVQICGSILDDPKRGTPSRAFAYANRAGAYYELHKLDLALADATQAVALWPEYPQAYVIRGTVLGDMGRIKEAIADLDKAIAMGAGFAPRLSRGHLLLRIGEPERARADLEEAVRLFPTPAGLMWRGYVYNALGLYDRAESDFSAGIRAVPEEPRMWIGRAEALLARGDRDKAASDVKKAVSYSKVSGPAGEASAKIWMDVGESLAHRGDYPNALAAFDAAVADFPSAQTYNDRCWHRATAGRDLAQARADCDRAVELAPGNSSVLDSRGLVRFRSGDLPGAMDDLDAALRASPRSADALYVRGLVKKRQGVDGGEADIAAAAAIRPDVAQEYARHGLAPQP